MCSVECFVDFVIPVHPEPGPEKDACSGQGNTIDNSTGSVNAICQTQHRDEEDGKVPEEGVITVESCKRVGVPARGKEHCQKAQEAEHVHRWNEWKNNRTEKGDDRRRRIQEVKESQELLHR